MIRYILFFLILFSVNAQALNVCTILKKHPQWYWAATHTQHKWGVPVSVQLAIMQQESDFFSDAMPKAVRLFGVALWHQSTATGFSQALDDTWHRYIKSTHKISANRRDFADASDFIGWYLNLIHHNLGVAKTDAYHLYLAYHEGMGGYHAKTYLRKPWLMQVARRVSHRAQLNHQQLIRCEKTLARKPWWRI